jgi:hypothetical protein
MIGHSDPPCAACSKPIPSDTLVLYRHGDLFHLACRSGATELQSFEEVDRAQPVQQHAARLLEDATRQRPDPPAKGPTAAPSTCPLCTEPATVTKWRPVSEWMVVEGCSCEGYFMWAPMLERVRALPARERRGLVRRIRDFRKSSHEAWFATTNGLVTGPLVIRPSQRPT